MLKKLLIKTYKNARELNDSFVIESIKKFGPFESVLDVGCWDGELTLEYSKAAEAKRILGIENDKSIENSAKDKGIEVSFLEADKDRWPIEDESLDCVVSNQVIEHLTDVDHFLSESNRVLKKGGYLITSTNNLGSWHNIWALVFGWAPFDLSNASKKGLGIGNPLSANKGGSIDGASGIHKCIYTPYWLFEWQKLYGFEKVNHFGSGLYPLPSIFGNIFKKNAAFMILTVRKI